MLENEEGYESNNSNSIGSSDPEQYRDGCTDRDITQGALDQVIQGRIASPNAHLITNVEALGQPNEQGRHSWGRRCSRRVRL